MVPATRAISCASILGVGATQDLVAAVQIRGCRLNRKSVCGYGDLSATDGTKAGRDVWNRPVAVCVYSRAAVQHAYRAAVVELGANCRGRDQQDSNTSKGRYECATRCDSSFVRYLSRTFCIHTFNQMAPRWVVTKPSQNNAILASPFGP